ncbi:unnamed protein product [Nezara viridula]|uniref:Uncharacterized protein n=1 Tax=Nezara viridula TaxID=85310 RepID=A0A9P0HHZ4_NEZVI|nr:unnamed protein product [Nezara viridula]
MQILSPGWPPFELVLSMHIPQPASSLLVINRQLTDGGEAMGTAQSPLWLPSSDLFVHRRELEVNDACHIMQIRCLLTFM